MARPAPSELDEETVPVPRSVRFPVELTPPESFDADDPATWPQVEGRLEWVAGRLLYMPPCADLQYATVADVVTVLGPWARARGDIVVGTNEAGMRLGDDARGADAAVWRRADHGEYRGKFSRVPPILAVEVAGRDEREPELRDKARWYLEAGVAVVWILLPDERVALVITPAGESRHHPGECLPSHPELPGLATRVDDLFAQISAS